MLYHHDRTVTGSDVSDRQQKYDCIIAAAGMSSLRLVDWAPMNPKKRAISMRRNVSRLR